MALVRRAGLSKVLSFLAVGATQPFLDKSTLLALDLPRPTSVSSPRRLPTRDTQSVIPLDPTLSGDLPSPVCRTLPSIPSPV